MSKMKTPSIIKFDPRLAQAIGLNEAILVSQVGYWLERKAKNDNFKTDKNGIKWTYNTYEEWQVNFPFWSLRTVRRVIESAEKLGILKSKLKGRGSHARSKWYTIDNDKLRLYLPEVEDGQVDQIDKGSGQDDQFNSSSSGQIGHLNQTDTKNTKNKDYLGASLPNGCSLSSAEEENLGPRLDISYLRFTEPLNGEEEDEIVESVQQYPVTSFNIRDQCQRTINWAQKNHKPFQSRKHYINSIKKGLQNWFLKTYANNSMIQARNDGWASESQMRQWRKESVKYVRPRAAIQGESEEDYKKRETETKARWLQARSGLSINVHN